MNAPRRNANPSVRRPDEERILHQVGASHADSEEYRSETQDFYYAQENGSVRTLDERGNVTQFQSLTYGASPGRAAQLDFQAARHQHDTRVRQQSVQSLPLNGEEVWQELRAQQQEQPRDAVAKWRDAVEPPDELEEEQQRLAEEQQRLAEEQQRAADAAEERRQLRRLQRQRMLANAEEVRHEKALQQYQSAKLMKGKDKDKDRGR
jgi:hypothetical protein